MSGDNLLEGPNVCHQYMSKIFECSLSRVYPSLPMIVSVLHHHRFIDNDVGMGTDERLQVKKSSSDTVVHVQNYSEFTAQLHVQYTYSGHVVFFQFFLTDTQP